MNCSSKTPFRDSVTDGVASILVNAILTPTSDFLWEVTDRFGNVYLIPFTTDEDGKGIIDAAELPAGFLNPTIGAFTVRVKKTPDSCEYEPMIMAVNYTALQMDVVKGNLPKSQVGCAVSFPVSPGLSSKAQTFTITEDQAGPTFTINEAISSLVVLRNGVSDEEVDFEGHTWTFVKPLEKDEVVRFLYNRT